ncbi:MAG: hypothetical protein ACQESR_07725 [Planctomycetota bacterium]
MTVSSDCFDEARVRDVLADKTCAEEQERFALHLESCPACRALLDAVSGADDVPAGVSQSSAEDELPVQLHELVERLKAECEWATSAGESMDTAPSSVSLNFLAPSERAEIREPRSDMLIFALIVAVGLRAWSRICRA